MDLSTFHSLMGGPLRSALTVLVSALLVTLVAIGVHRAGIGLLKKLANGHPFTRN